MGETPADRRMGELSVEEELHLKEDAMDGAPVGITISDTDLPDNPLIYVNDSFVDITGYEREEIIGTNCRFLQGEDTDPDRVAAMAAAVEHEQDVAVELKNYRKDGEPFWNRVEIAPIRRDGDVQYFVGYQADVTDRKEAEIALAEERATLAHVLSRVTSLVPDVAESIVESDSREALESSLAERFATVSDLERAWVGRYNPSTGLVKPVAGEGRPDEPLSVTGEAETGPLARAVTDGTVTVTSEPAELFGATGPTAAALIPLRYRDTVYGLLAVGSTEPDVFDDRETVVMAAIGKAAGAALNAIERVSLAAAETVTEARIEVADRSMPLVSLAETLSGEITADGRVTASGDGPVVLLTVSGGTGQPVAEVVESDPSLAIVAETETSMVLEWTVPDGPLARSLQDARLDGLSATPTGVTLRFETASKHMANTVVGRFREAYGGVELLAFHEVSDRAVSGEDFRESVTQDLTERQLEALQKAYVSGFFDWPRAVEGEALAEAMSIHPSTFHQHLRAAEGKLIGAYLDR
ncbi:MAG: PAS domain-containing protein [Halodesulfurarchaeum sp.]